jgi:type I restriction enzyme S subunit
MTKKSDAPAIRFKGFSDAWEQRKLGDIGETYTGLSGKTKADFGHGQARFVTYMNVFSNPISNPEMTEPIEIDPKQNEVEVGDVFFTTSSETPEEVGMSSVLLEKRGKTYLNSFCFGFRPSEIIDSYYLAYMLRSESARDKIILLAQGISRYNISKNKVMEIAVSLPSLDEQKLIGQYFRQLDNLITLHQRKFEKLTNVKKSMLEKMFPQNGSSYPEIRFKGFTDPWEQRKVSELFRVTRGYVLAATQTETTKTDEKPYPVYSSQTKDKGLMGYYKDYLYEDAITWTTDGANAGTVNYRAGKFYCTNVCGVLLSNEVKANQMIAEALNSVAKGYVSYVGNPKLMNNVMADIVIQIPTQAEEREQLSSFFAKLDNLITLHQRKPFLMKWRTSDANRNQTNRLVL